MQFINKNTKETANIWQIRQKFPHISFPSDEKGMEEILVQNPEYGYAPIRDGDKPIKEAYEVYTSEISEESDENGYFMRLWNTVHASDEQIEHLRKAAYKSESDPLYMEWQYDQTEEKRQAWINSVAEIKARYPKQ